MGGSAAGRLTATYFGAAAALGAAGGSESHTLTNAESYPVTFTTGTESQTHAHTVYGQLQSSIGTSGGNWVQGTSGNANYLTSTESTTHTHSGTTSGGGGAHAIASPMLQLNKIIYAGA
jgi:hypothetical protein